MALGLSSRPARGTDSLPVRSTIPSSLDRQTLQRQPHVRESPASLQSPPGCLNLTAMTGPAYWDRHGYRVAMRLLYGRHYRDRYEAVASRIKPGWSVVDLCCGDCRLYTQELADRPRSYFGLDINKTFVRQANRRGISAKVCNLRVEPVPPADAIVMQGSLFQFVPDHDELIERMLRAAQHMVIIAEPITNLASSSSKIVAGLARWFSHPGTHHNARRFTDGTIRKVFARHSCLEYLPIAGGRELLGLFDAKKC